MKSIEIFQSEVHAWWVECFRRDIEGDTAERNQRFLEESLELVQSLGCTASEAHQLVDYVFVRPVGRPEQEVGGTMVTLSALCSANKIDLEMCAESELERVKTKIEQIRAKDAAKPKHSPLPQETPGEIKQSTLREAAIAICPLCAGGNKYVSREPLLESEHTAGECRWFHRYSDTNEIAARCEAWKINDLIVKVTE